MIRFILLLLLFLFSLLTVFKAFEFHLWLIAILAGELSWVFALIAGIVLATGYRFGKYQMPGTVLGILAVILFLTPVFRGLMVANKLSTKFGAAFGPGTANVDNAAEMPYNPFKSLYYRRKEVPFSSLTYVNYGKESLNLDFYASQIAGKRPCVIVVHGGSWKGGNSRQIPELNGLLAEKGYQVAAINYRKAPAYRSPAPVEDVRAAMGYLRRHADSLQIDTGRFVLIGRSAGSQIALLAAYSLADPSIKGVVDFYGPADMVWGYSIPSNPLIMDSRKVMSDYLGGPYEKVPGNYAASSPLEFVSRRSPPTLIIHGENDVLVAYEHSRRLNEKLQENGVKHFWLQLPWATHGFDYIQNGPGGQLSNYVIERFLRYATK
ncbi:alpha/beta hydrolase [Hufsiella ginkgonis]|uniref:Alpha/beta hydrolase fold domain-containing protein n=1 Tax=Hufsiella ginkgonis TaxID=2695274 RepID=A0A7K1XZE8_9SPHI|nr:alpha/beta hydrolase [Hufsiella ginkgonis]MXV16109.1 alpha/beta hydrolase fold domain-containing protein [Hufsiella ginkgonis]